MKSTTLWLEMTAMIKYPTLIPHSCYDLVTKLLVGALLQLPHQSWSQKIGVELFLALSMVPCAIIELLEGITSL
jgi:hypothetical protein